MDAKTFVTNWAQHKEQLLNEFFDSDSESYVRTLIDDLNLNSAQQTQIRQVIDVALTDTMYGLLLGLDGEANIGGDQRTYRIVDEESGQAVASAGELEAAAYECFHGEK